MSNTATKQDLADLRNDLRQDIRQSNAEILEVLQTFMHQVDERFNRVESEHEEQKQSFDRLITTIDGFLSRIDRYEAEQAARDRQFERLVAWAHKVSEKTGIPLENL